MRVLLLVPNPQLRLAVQTLLVAEQYDVGVCTSLAQVVTGSDHAAPTVALVDWQSMEGLLSDEHRGHLAELTRRLRLVLIVPRRWARLLEGTDLYSTLAGIIARPFEADELLGALQNALAPAAVDA
jgi:DNA-binding response OmpR family regulator